MAKQSGISNIAVIGIEWGDEGKGKIVDFLAEKSDVIARFNGGNNAGHTIEVGDKKFTAVRLQSQMGRRLSGFQTGDHLPGLQVHRRNRAIARISHKCLGTIRQNGQRRRPTAGTRFLI